MDKFFSSKWRRCTDAELHTGAKADENAKKMTGKCTL